MCTLLFVKALLPWVCRLNMKESLTWQASPEDTPLWTMPGQTWRGAGPERQTCVFVCAAASVSHEANGKGGSSCAWLTAVVCVRGVLGGSASCVCVCLLTTSTPQPQAIQVEAGWNMHTNLHAAAQKEVHTHALIFCEPPPLLRM